MKLCTSVCDVDKKPVYKTVVHDDGTVSELCFGCYAEARWQGLIKDGKSVL